MHKWRVSDHKILVCSVLQHTQFSGVCCVVSDIRALTSTPPPPPPSSEGAAANATEKPMKLGRLPEASRTSPPLVSSTSHPSNPSHFQVEVTFHLKHQQFSSWGSPRPWPAENFIDQNLAGLLHVQLSLPHSVPDTACPSGTTRRRSSFFLSPLPLLSFCAIPGSVGMTPISPCHCVRSWAGVSSIYIVASFLRPEWILQKLLFQSPLAGQDPSGLSRSLQGLQ